MSEPIVLDFENLNKNDASENAVREKTLSINLEDVPKTIEKKPFFSNNAMEVLRKRYLQHDKRKCVETWKNFSVGLPKGRRRRSQFRPGPEFAPRRKNFFK
jgi:hypothetical protein